MRRLLLINPNTSPSVSALLLRHAQETAEQSAQIEVVTARFGAPYIACEASFAVGAHAVLDAWAAVQAEVHAQARAPFDAVLIACFGDPGLLALRQICPVPVTALAEAAFAKASRQGPFAVVTGGTAWEPMLARLVHSLGYGPSCAAIHTLAATGAQLARDPAGATALLGEACATVVAASGAKVVILGGAGLAGMAQAVQATQAVPVIDSVIAGVQHALELCGTPIEPPEALGFSWQGLSPALTAVGD